MTSMMISSDGSIIMITRRASLIVMMTSSHGCLLTVVALISVLVSVLVLPLGLHLEISCCSESSPGLTVQGHPAHFLLQLLVLAVSLDLRLGSAVPGPGLT